MNESSLDDKVDGTRMNKRKPSSDTFKTMKSHFDKIFKSLFFIMVLTSKVRFEIN